MKDKAVDSSYRVLIAIQNTLDILLIQERHLFEAMADNRETSRLVEDLCQGVKLLKEFKELQDMYNSVSTQVLHLQTAQRACREQILKRISQYG